MAQLTSMKLTKKERKEEMAVDVKPPEYPWGLTINLDSEALEKLGHPKFEVGDKVQVVAMAEVRSTSEHKDERKVTESMSLQLTDMALDKPSKSNSERASKLFGKSE